MKMRITVNGTAYDVDVEVLDAAGAPTAVAAPPPAVPVASAPVAAPAAPPKPAAPPPPTSAGGNDVASPIAGNVLSVKVKPGDAVEMNDTLLVLEAMKMESNVASPRAGTVSEVLVSQGDAVTAGQVLVKFG
ncbi:MAG: biotin/lipoyl-containing protein [Planctomycetota bacterium]